MCDILKFRTLSDVWLLSG